MKKTICDVCENTLSGFYDLNGKNPIRVIKDNVNYDFCNIKCLLQFVLNELKKQNPRKNIELGKEKL